MIRKTVWLMALISGVCGLSVATPTTATSVLTWNNFPDLPDSKGRGGIYAGASGGALIVGGGTNFPGALLWENGTKSWYDDLAVLSDGSGQWKQGYRLPGAARAYGVSVTTAEGVVIAGGADSKRHYAEVFLIKWNGSELTTKTLPSLPQPVAYASGGIIGDTIYLIGGLAETSATAAQPDFYALNLTRAETGWQSREPFPGETRILPAVTAFDGSLYVCAGSNLSSGQTGEVQRKYLTDAWKYTPGKGWTQLANMPRGSVAAPALGDPHTSTVMVLGGDFGQYTDLPKKDQPLFTREILAYSTSNTWSSAGEMPLGQLTAPVVPWNDGWLLVGGEIRHSIRTPKIYHAESGNGRDAREAQKK